MPIELDDSELLKEENSASQRLPCHQQQNHHFGVGTDLA